MSSINSPSLYEEEEEVKEEKEIDLIVANFTTNYTPTASQYK